MKKITILSPYNQAHAIIPSHIIKPFWASKGNPLEEMLLSPLDKEFLEKNTLKGDEGENIAPLAHLYKDFSATYWAYKNLDKLGDPDYIGIIPPGQHFNFSLAGEKKNSSPPEVFENLDDFYIKSCGLEDESINKAIQGLDALLPLPIKLGSTVSKHYLVLHKEDEFLSGFHDSLQQTIDCLKDKYPEFTKTANEFVKGDIFFASQSFIMKKELFLEYAEWLFSILFTLQKKLGVTKDFAPTIKSAQIFSFLAEQLTYIYFKHLENNSLLSIKYAPQALVNNTKIREGDIKPAFPTNNIPVCFTFSGPHEITTLFLVSLQSLINHTSQPYNYDIIVCTEKYTPTQKECLLEIFKDMVLGKNNISIRLFDMYSLLSSEHIKYLEQIKNSKKHTDFLSRYTVATLFRLFLPILLPHYEKIIYLDVDTLILEDIALLYHTDLQNHSLALAMDTHFKEHSCFQIEERGEFCKIFYNKSYYNAGIAVMNLTKMRQNSILNDLSKTIKELFDKNYLWSDQDFLNIHFMDDIKELDIRWNFPVYYAIRPSTPLFITHEQEYQVQLAQKKPSILHFIGDVNKPWVPIMLTTKASYEWFKVEKTLDYPREMFVPITTQKIVHTLRTSIEKTLNKGSKKMKFLKFFYKKTAKIAQKILKK